MSGDRPGAAPGGRRALGLGGVLLIVAAAWLAWQLAAVLAVVAGAALLAAALEPVVSWLTRLSVGRRSLGRSPAALLTVAALLGLVVLAVTLVVPTLARETREAAAWLPRAYESVQRQIAAWQTGLGGPDSQWVTLLHDEGGRLLADAGRAFGAFLLRMTTNFVNLLGLFVIPVGAYYFLADGPELKAILLRYVAPQHRVQVAEIVDLATRSLSAYIRGQSSVCLAAAALNCILFAILGLPNPVLLGTLAGLAEAVPFLGATVVAVLVGLAGMTDGVGRALLAVGVYVAASNTFVNYIIAPRLLSRQLEMHPFVVVLAVLAGTTLGGVAGALLALPVAVVGQSLAARFLAGEGPAGGARGA